MVASPAGNLAPADVDKLIATGLLRMAPDGTGDLGAEPNVARNDVIAETIKIVSSRVSGPDGRLRPVPRPPLRPDFSRGLLPVPRLFEPALDWKHRAAREAPGLTVVRRRPRAPAAADADVKQILSERATALEELVQQVLERELAASARGAREALRAARATPLAKRTPEQASFSRTTPGSTSRPATSAFTTARPIGRCWPPLPAGSPRPRSGAPRRGRCASPDRGGRAGPHHVSIRTGRLRNPARPWNRAS